MKESCLVFSDAREGDSTGFYCHAFARCEPSDEETTKVAETREGLKAWVEVGGKLG